MFDKLVHKYLKLPYTLNVHTHRKYKKTRKTVVFLHGLGNSGAAWEDVIQRLPKTCNVISVDLMGFGKSPRPDWAVYDVRTQARSVAKTLISLRLNSRVVIVGHSLGALVAVEVTKRYPLLVRSLILCSPPFYDPSSDKNRLLHAAFRRMKKRPDQFVRLVATADKYNLINKTFTITEDTVHSYIETLHASILTQTSLSDAIRIRKPMTMIFGTYDPLVKKKNLKKIIHTNKNATLLTIRAGHEVKGAYVPKLVQVVGATLANDSKANIRIKQPNS